MAKEESELLILRERERERERERLHSLAASHENRWGVEIKKQF